MVNQNQIEASLKDRLNILEPQRIQLRRTLFLTVLSYYMIASFLVGCIFLLAYNLSEAVNPELAPVFTGLCTFFPSILVVMVTQNQATLKEEQTTIAYQHLVRTEGYLPTFQEWNASLSYAPKQVVAQEDVQRAQIIDQFHIMEGDDYCEGKLEDGRPFKFSEIKLFAKEILPYQSDYVEPLLVTAYKGLFFVIKNNNPVVEPGQYLKLSAKALPKVKGEYFLSNFFKKETTDILDADFDAATLEKERQLDQHFELFTENQPIIQQFPPSFSQSLIHLKEDLQGQLTVVFTENEAQEAVCYVAVPHEDEFWEVSLKQSLRAPKIYKNLAWNFAHCFMIVEAIAALTTTEKLHS